MSAKSVPVRERGMLQEQRQKRAEAFGLATARAAQPTPDQIEALQRQLGECSGGYQTLEREVEALRKRIAKLEADARDKAAERLAYDAVIDLLLERLPDAKCMGELPGVVDELRQQLAAVRADAERLDSGRIAITVRNDFLGENVLTVFQNIDLRAAIDTARKQSQP